MDGLKLTLKKEVFDVLPQEILKKEMRARFSILQQERLLLVKKTAVFFCGG